METTQLTLLFGSRSQPSTKPTLQPSDDGAERAFSSMLQKSLAEQAEQRQIDQQRQLDQERQNWRNQQPTSYAASQPASAPEPTPAPAPSSSASDASSSRPADKTPSRSDSKDRSSASTAASSSSQQASAASDKNGSKSAGKTGKSSGSANKDGDQSSGTESASATGNQATGKQDAHHHGQATDGDAQSDGGQKKNQNQQDGQPQQSAADGDAVAVASEGAENTILAALLAGQPATTKGAAVSPTAAAGGQKAAVGAAAGVNLTAAGAASGQAGGTAQAAGNAAATTAAAGLPVPGSIVPSAAASAGQAGNSTGAGANAAQPQATATLAAGAHAASTSELDNTFANIIAKKVTPASSNSDNLRVSVNKASQDNAPQLPRPLIRISGNQAPQSNTQPTLTEDETVSVANRGDDLDDNFDPQPTGFDGLSGFGSFSSSLPGADLGGIGKQIDSMAALRQQLATASLQNQVATQMQRAASSNVDKISIDLSPAELGRIHVKMSVSDDKQVSATISVERPATLELLQRDTKGLERALQDAGLKTDSGNLSFTLQQGNQGNSSDTPGWGGNGGRQVGSSEQEKTAGTVDGSSAAAKNEVDTANGLVNVAV